MGFAGRIMNGSGVEWYYAIGAIIFVTLFIIILVRTMRMPKQDLEHYKNFILEEDDNSKNLN